MKTVMQRIGWTVLGLVTVAAMTGALGEKLQTKTLGWALILGVVFIVQFALFLARRHPGRLGVLGRAVRFPFLGRRGKGDK